MCSLDLTVLTHTIARNELVCDLNWGAKVSMVLYLNWLNWLCYLAGSSKSHRENSISCTFLESPYQVDMENVVKCYKHFFGISML